MLMETLGAIKTRNPLRVFAVFAAGIILPSAFLSYLGLRSFQYEGALMQKQTEERYATVADVIQKKVGDQLLGWVDSLEQLARDPSVDQLRPPALLTLILSTPKLKDLPIQNLFVFDDQEQMVAPWSADAASSRDDELPHAVNWGAWGDEIERLDHLEFVDKNIAQAIEGYATLQRQRLPATLEAQLQKNIADGYRKLHQPRQAEAAYLKLAHDYDNVVDTSGLPMGVLARQLLAIMYDGEKEPDHAFDTRMDVLEGIAESHWRISASRQATLTEAITPAIGRSAESRARWERLQHQKSRIDALQTGAKAFAQDTWPALYKRLHQRGWMEKGGILKLSDGGHGPAMAIVAPIFSPDSGRRAGLFVAVIDDQTIWSTLEKMIDDYARPLDLHVTWDHGSSAVSAPNRMWNEHLERSVDGVDPPVHFQLFESISQDQARLSHRRLWIYGGMIALSFVVIVVGLVAMRQAVKREMEVANLKADFVANVSHELRTPLTTISYVGERLNLGRYRTEEERQKFYGMLDRETHRLKDLIEDVLDFSKMLAGKKVYKQETLDLGPVVQEAYERFQGKARAKGFEVNVDLAPEDVTIKGDRTALIQGILNLIDNAVKYSGASRKVNVSLAKKGRRAVIAVQDFGIGIPDAEREKIFEKFYRVEQGLARDTDGGVGLGLAMVKHVVEGLGGTIRVDSRLGEGSTFVVEFPLV